MDTDLDAILRRVAAGELTPEEALPLIDTVKADSGPQWGSPTPGESATGGTAGAPESTAPGRGDDLTGEPPSGRTGTPDSSDESAGSAQGPATTVRIAASYRSLDVIADAGVDQIAVTGEHSVRREGGTLIIESLQLPVFGGVGDWREQMGDRFSFASIPRGIAWARSMKDEHLMVRVNPRLMVEMDVAAAGVRVSGLEGGARIRLVAASLKVDRLRGQLEIDAMSSSVKGTAAITGTSRISCESSSVKLALLPGTDVRARATNRLGKVVLSSRVSKGGFNEGEITETVLGEGHGELTVEAVMSSVVLAEESTDRHRTSA